jgi:hypothetical protein
VSKGALIEDQDISDRIAPRLGGPGVPLLAKTRAAPCDTTPQGPRLNDASHGLRHTSTCMKCRESSDTPAAYVYVPLPR